MVKYVSDKTGRFSYRPHYQPIELDEACEQIVTAFLKSQYGTNTFPIATEDIIRLIEQNVDYLDPYADLSEFGQDVEGLTEFHAGNKPSVQISGGLMEDQRRENRLRTTLTHELGHVCFHAPLFERNYDQLTLFSSPTQSDIIICNRDGILNASPYDWMEWQAGYACGAFLMPRSYLLLCLTEFTNGRNVTYPVEATSQVGFEIIRLVAERFQVSRDAARVRLSQLNYLSNNQQTPSFY
jgi:hypothetical protein